MNQITSMFGYQDESGEDAHIALEAVLEKLHLPYPEDASLLDKIELVSHSALVLFRTCDKMKRKNDSLVMSKESLQEYSKNMLIKISQKEELLQFYKVNTDFDEPVDDDDEKRSKFEILRSLLQKKL